MFHRKIKNLISIVEKLIYHSLTGQTPGLNINNHLKCRIHFCWTTKAGTHQYIDCIERSFIREKVGLRFCKALKMFRLFCIAACIVRGITYEGDHRIQRCIFLEKAIRGSHNVWKRHRQKYLNTCLCFCRVNSSSVIR
jgi:hypothetical protein